MAMMADRREDIAAWSFHSCHTYTEENMKRKREPTTPGEILREEFLVPLGMTQKELADHIGCDVKVINRLVNGRTSVSAEMALRLGATFRTSPEFWLNAQKAVDLFRAEVEVPDLPPPVLKAS
jgi:addiction module HigA family antidote